MDFNDTIRKVIARVPTSYLITLFLGLAAFAIITAATNLLLALFSLLRFRLATAIKKLIYVGLSAGILFFVMPIAADVVLCGKIQGSVAVFEAQKSDKEKWQRIKDFHDKLELVSDFHADTMLWPHRGSIMKSTGFGHVDYPRMVAGNQGLQVFSTVSKIPFTQNFDSNKNNTDIIGLLGITQRWPLSTLFSLYDRVVAQSSQLHQLESESNGLFKIIKNKADLEYVLETRRTKGHQVVAGLYSIEGLQVLENKLENVDKLFDELGVRMVGLSHFTDNEVGGSAHGDEKYGLTAFGRQVLDRMVQRHFIIDLAHASEALFWDVVKATETSKVPLIVSHAGVRGTCDNSRNLSDEQIKAIAARRGVIGVAFFSKAICGTTLDDITNAMMHIKKVLGNVDNIVLGSDWDGAVTVVLDSAELPHLTFKLFEEGFTEDEVAKIMSNNSIELFKRILPK